MIGRTSRISGLGLGPTNLVYDPNSQTTIDCNSWSNFFNSACWGQGVAVSALPSGTSAPAPAAVDCNNFWNALTDSSCSFSTYASSTLFLPSAVLAAAAIMEAKRSGLADAG